MSVDSGNRRSDSPLARPVQPSASATSGAALIVLHLACVALVCVPYLLAELILGSHTAKNPVGAIHALRPEGPRSIVGSLGVLTGIFT